MIRLDPSRRSEAIEAGWLAYRDRLPEHREAYLRACEGWSVIAVCDDDVIAGALMAKDGVIHLGIKPEYRGRWASRRVIREMLSHGRKTTLMPGEDPEFIQRIGFVKTGDGYVVRR